MTSTVAPDAILKQLTDLWVSLGKPSESGAGVLRACSMTLISITDEEIDSSALGETIAALMPEHPARSILVRLGAGTAPGLSARVYSQCWMPFGQRRQICCEQVEITVSGGELEDVAALLLPLCVPDLPVIVWARSGRAVTMPGFAAIAELGHKVIVDSQSMEAPRPALEWLAGAAERRILAGDLAWTRLSRWRELLARLFDNRELQALLPALSLVRVGCAPGQPSTAALYMGAWVAGCLRVAGAEASVGFDSDPAGPVGEISSVTLSAADGSAPIRLEAQGEVLRSHAGGVSQCAMLPRPTEYALLREELAVVRQDTVFARTLPSALQLAVSSGANERSLAHLPGPEGSR